MQGVNVRTDNKVAMNVGGNLELASIQDHSRSENFSLDLSYGFGEDSSSYGSGFNAGKFKKDWVANQTSITGGNEVDISVGGNTHLKGSLIAQAKEVEIDDPNAKDGSKIKTIRFGQQGAETAGDPKKGESDRMKKKRASFKARHGRNIAKGKMSAAYWADKVKW